ncbi:siphovirus Gp157 family protein [Comamonas sp. JUb58]|uniref:siphovirus Gp157 family protein n=1 Tax=Comamonas sp. JUb58 TaxID=2485114 RepID=UPI00105E6124|nr:siphovirus Gp157 family protein [Comamonas sp. JUb58]TDS82585.1 viral Gp157 protein [Comamonas sp. JUb58]
MTAVTLFDLAQQVRESVNQTDPETGEITENYSANRSLFENKALACVAYAKEEEATLEGAKAMLKEMTKKLEAREKRLERFKGYVADNMKATGILEIKHEFGIFGAKLYLDRDESVILQPGAEFPASLCNDPKPATPSLTKIKKAIKEGEPVAGAELVRRDRLQIS